MNKQKFLAKLRAGLSGLKQKEIKEHLAFYSEMIDDRMEEGLSEEAAVSAIGSVDDIVEQIMVDNLLDECSKVKRVSKTLAIVLLILGSPLWVSLLAAVFAVLLAAMITIWSVILSLWSGFAALAASSLVCMAAGGVFACYGNAVSGLAMLGGGFICAGLSVFAFYGCRAITGFSWRFTQKIAACIKKYFFSRKGEV